MRHFFFLFGAPKKWRCAPLESVRELRKKTTWCEQRLTRNIGYIL